MERRFLSNRPVKLEHRDAGDKKSPTITGYASVFYNASDPGTEYELWSGLVERIMPGAFDRALKEADDVRALFNHDPACILGRTAAGTCRLSVDMTGLNYVIDLPDTQLARDLAESIRRGDVSGSSFAFIPDEITWREKDGIEYCEINSVQLFDVGPVVYPAYPAATTGVRSAGDVSEIRAAYEAHRKQLTQRTGQLAAYARRARLVQIEN